MQNEVSTERLAAYVKKALAAIKAGEMFALSPAGVLRVAAIYADNDQNAQQS